jgi:hypothetical protein
MKELKKMFGRSLVQISAETPSIPTRNAGGTPLSLQAIGRIVSWNKTRPSLSPSFQLHHPSTILQFDTVSHGLSAAWCNNSLAQRNKIALLEKLLVAQLLKNFPTFYETRNVITVFTGVFHWSLSWAISIQFIPCHPIPLRSHFLDVSFCFSHQNPKCITISSTRATCPACIIVLYFIIPCFTKSTNCETEMQTTLMALQPAKING